MKGKFMFKKTLALILAFTILSPIASRADDLDISPKIENDALKETNDLDLAPINEDFNKGEGQKSSPLTINENDAGTSQRSMLPRKYDLRKLDRTSPVRRQGNNGSCWAFAAYGSMESFLKPFGDYDFSEKHMRNTHGFDWGNDDGGNRDIATAYLARGDGPINEEDDPYEEQNFNSPQGLERSLDIEKVLYIRDMNSAYDNKEIKRAIMEYGGVYTVINSSKYYESTKYNSYYNPGSGRADHAVTIVGWDDDFSRNAFTKKAPGDGAWICKNSWGEGYMDDGYYYVSYYDNYAGSGNAVFVPKKRDNSSKIYQYDPLGATRSVGYAGKGYMANIFTASRNESLKEVGLYNVSANTKYKIYMVEDLKKTSELSDKKKEIASGVFKNPGYYTVDIDKIPLKKGQNFGLVVYMDSSSEGYRYPMPVEARIKNFSSKAKSENNQSLVSSDGKKWSDLNKALPNANFCIKALTTTIEKTDFEFKKDDKIDEDSKEEEKPDENSGKDDSNVKIESIDFAEGDRGYIDVSQKGQLTALISPKDADEKIYFKSSKPEVCVVDENEGILYPRNYGNVNIVAKSASGKVSKVYNLQVVPVDLRVQGRDQVTIIGENDYIPEDEDIKDEENNEESEDDDNNGLRPGEEEIKKDPKEPRNITTNLNLITIHKDESYKLEDDVLLYPLEAEKNLSYISDNPSIADVDDEGNLIALNEGETKIKIITHNNLATSIDVKVLKKNDPTGLELVEITNTEKKAGIFSLDMKAKLDGKPYNGGAILKLQSDDEDKRVIERKVYFNNGKASSKYTGFDFGVWRDSYIATLKIKDKISSYDFNFKDEEEIDESENTTENENTTESEDTEEIIDSTNPELVSFETTERKGGIFDIILKAQDDNGPYNGDGLLTISSDERVMEVKLNFEDGQCVERFTGFDFGVWRNIFDCEIEIEDEVYKAGFSFE